MNRITRNGGKAIGIIAMALSACGTSASGDPQAGTERHAGPSTRRAAAGGERFVPRDVDWEHPLYETSFDAPAALKDWRLEGGQRMSVAGGNLVLESDRLSTKSEGAANHLVCWLRREMPGDFLLEFSVCPEDRKRGLNIVFFNARGLHGENIFEPPIRPRDGEFHQYHSGDINNYHISYWAGGRGTANLRKNKGFHLVAVGRDLIEGAKPGAFQVVRVYKRGGRIVLTVDDIVALSCEDDGRTYGPVHTDSGWIGLRQMAHTQRCEYGYVKVYGLKQTAEAVARSTRRGVPPPAQPRVPVDLMPAVSEVEWGESLVVDGHGTIVLGEQAGAPERAAARLLAQYVERRFARKWPVSSAGDPPADVRLRVFLGRSRTFPALERICNEQHLSVPEQEDGYALRVMSDGKAITAVVAGTNGRSVIYGADTLFQLFRQEGERLTVQAATIRDKPAIRLRGRPHPHYQYYLQPENFDCMMTSRINFIDLRDGIYAFEPGAKLPKEDLSRIIRDARDRELRVYAAVNCGVPAEQQDAVIATFRELIGLGADGLWASFDDKGAGADPKTMVSRILALGREHGITGDAIAVTPPKGDYQTINTRFNREIVGVPGMEQAVWYFTSVPCAEDAAAGEAIGLRVRPSWWHNWPRLPHPSLYSGSGSYTPVVSLADGWNHPNDRELTEMGRYVHAVMPWDGWQAQQHYLVPTIGWWSWRPERHDFQAVRRRIYDMVFGPEQAATAAAFDDALKAIQKRFQYWSTHTEYAPQCPPRLKSLEDRERTRAELEALRGRLPGLREGASSASLLDRPLLQREYLDAMAREVETGLAAAQAPYPEYWWPAHQDALLRTIYDGQTARAEALIAGVRDRVLGDVAEVERLLASLGTTRQYVDWWKKRATATPADWKKLIDNRQAELRERIAEYGRTVAPISQMLSNLNDPPIQVGTGVWSRHNHLLATVPPEPHETFWGDWIGGLYDHAGTKVAAFALAKHLPVNAGVYTELPVNVPISGRRDRLALLIYLADANKESFGLGRARWRWSGYRSIRLLWDGKELWKADLGIPRLTGEWFVVNLPPIPADVRTLPLRLRVEDYYSAKNNLEIVYVGPIHLVELDRD